MLLRIDEGIEGGEDALNFLIAGRDGLLGQIIEREGLGAGEHMFGAVIPLQRFGNGLLARWNAVVSILGSGLRIAFPRDNGAENPHPRHASHLTNHVVQMEIHLIQ